MSSNPFANSTNTSGNACFFFLSKNKKKKKKEIVLRSFKNINHKTVLTLC